MALVCLKHRPLSLEPRGCYKHRGFGVINWRQDEWCLRMRRKMFNSKPQCFINAQHTDYSEVNIIRTGECCVWLESQPVTDLIDYKWWRLTVCISAGIVIHFYWQEALLIDARALMNNVQLLWTTKDAMYQNRYIKFCLVH